MKQNHIVSRSGIEEDNHGISRIGIDARNSCLVDVVLTKTNLKISI